VCYAVGFGIARDNDQAKKILCEMGLSDKELEHQVHSIRDAEVGWGVQNINLERLIFQGHILPIDLAQHYRENNLLHKAEQFYKREIKDTRDPFTETHWLSLLLSSQFGKLLESQGQWKEVEELQVQVMETRKKVLGVEHPDTLNSMANLASTYRNQGGWKEAKELQVQVMETFKKLLGVEHPYTLASMGNLASTYRNQGQWKEAEELEMQVVEAFKRVLGVEHPTTLTSMANLTSTFWNQGRWKEAEKLQVQVMETRKRVLRAEHPSTLISVANLASTYRDQGQ
jgi:tetratricopeptide (TPR) repeat protein